MSILAYVAGDRQTATKMLITAAVIVVDMIWISLTDFTFAPASAIKVVGVVALLLAIGWFYRVHRPMKNFEVMCSETAILLAFSSSAAVLSYLVTSLNLPLIDPWLIKTDALIGFEWMAYSGTIYGDPLLSTISTIVYVTTITQVAFCVILLGLSGQFMIGRRLGAAVVFSGLICVGISGILPSAGAMGYLQPDPAFINAGTPIVDLAYKQVFFDLRSGVERFISLDALHGLIAFPSYHGTLSALVVISLWNVPYVRYPALLLNAAVIAFTPAEGGHHLTDALAGVLVAFLAWYLAGVFARKIPATMLPGAEPVRAPIAVTN